MMAQQFRNNQEPNQSDKEEHWLHSETVYAIQLEFISHGHSRTARNCVLTER